MAQNSTIEWTDHTFNPWWGCTKISPGCKHCYAERLARRFNYGVWGADKTRRMFGPDHWMEPVLWHRKALRDESRPRVFCGSMCDVFEEHPDVGDARRNLWELIEQTPRLIWLLLTKRPANIYQMVPHRWLQNPRPNIWYGSTICHQDELHDNAVNLLTTPAAGHFFSIEPMLGPLDIHEYIDQIDWIITGGESGSKARAIYPAWLEDLRDQCDVSGTPFFFKQWGDYKPDVIGKARAFHKAGWDPDQKRGGRILRGRTWEQLPYQLTPPDYPRPFFSLPRTDNRH